MVTVMATVANPKNLSRPPKWPSLTTYLPKMVTVMVTAPNPKNLISVPYSLNGPY